MKVRVGLGMAALLAAASAFAAPSPRLPVSVPEASWRPLEHHLDRDLQRALVQRIRTDNTRVALAAKGKLGVGLVDLRDPEHPRFAHLNGDRMMYAASLPKIALLLAAEDAIDKGNLVDGPQLQKDMGKMIRVSSNKAATAVIDRLGFESIAGTLTDPRFKLYDARRGGGLWVGKRFAKRGRRVGDPLKNISHAASATQVARFYYMLATGKALSPERSARMLGHLSRPGLNHYFVGAVRRRAPKAKLFRKSGTWSVWRADSALVWGPERRYILVGLVEGGPGKKILQDLVPIAEDALRATETGLRSTD